VFRRDQALPLRAEGKSCRKIAIAQQIAGEADSLRPR
jgi:hypothetical protein